MGMKIRIGELLVQEDVISCEQLEHALQDQRKRGRRLGRTLAGENKLSGHDSPTQLFSNCP